MAMDMAYDPPDFFEFEPYHTPPPPSPFPPPPIRYDDAAENLKTALMTGAVVSFIVLIAKDAHRAFMTRAHRIPCDFLVLSAFSVQLLSLLNAQNQAVSNTPPSGKGDWVIRAQRGVNEVTAKAKWGIAAAYHTRSQTDSWRSDLRIEDFWTRHLRELQEARKSRARQAQSIDNKTEQLVFKEPITVSVPSILLYAAFGMQWVLVSFSKVCWLASLVIFHNKLMGKFYNFVFEKHIMYVFEDYPKYRKILKDVQMLGESPESLWVANRKSIVRAKSLIIQGNQDGECNCEDLVDFMSNKKTGNGLGLSCLHPHKPQTGLKFLCKKRPMQRTPQPEEGTDVEKRQSGGGEMEPLAIEEQFTGLCKKSWKMTAVSLLGIIVHLSTLNGEVDKEHCSTSDSFPAEAVKDCLKVYSQAWEILDFVEAADTEADGITSEAADKYFQFLQKKVEKEDFSPNDSRHARTGCVPKALEDLIKESKQKMEPFKSVNGISGLIHARKGEKQGIPDGWEGNDSIDWKAAASGLAVYNLCNSIECNDGTDVNELLKELESSLADIINECFERVQHLLLLYSRKWALSRDERLLGKTLYTAGKAKVIMERLAWNKVGIVSLSLIVRFLFCYRCVVKGCFT
ncbi:hypothetical protein SUGI_0850020 [Cryptomeria japonica]|nr:hypothetical protein SUGI_0850020 [Cryptomeria japonica]